MGMQIAMHAQHRRDADGQMDVRAALLRAEFQERVDARQRCSLFSTRAGLRGLEVERGFNVPGPPIKDVGASKFDVTHGFTV